MSRWHTVTVQAEVEWSELDTDDLIEEIESRGYKVSDKTPITDHGDLYEHVEELEQHEYIVVDSNKSPWFEEIRDEINRFFLNYRSDVVYEKLKQL